MFPLPGQHRGNRLARDKVLPYATGGYTKGEKRQGKSGSCLSPCSRWRDWSKRITEVPRLVRRQVQPALIAAGGMAVALNIDGRTLFFNYGMADVARQQPITSDSLFNLASVGKAVIATLLAPAVEQGQEALHDPVARYVTER